MYILKLERENERKLLEHETLWLHTRVIWCTMLNLQRDKKKQPIPFKPEDLITLSFDKKKIKKSSGNLFEEMTKAYGKTLDGK